MSPPCCPQFGFAGASFVSSESYQGQGVGDDAISWGFDGERGQCWHGERQEVLPDFLPFSTRRWKVGDVIGLAVNLDAGALYVSVNGVYLEGGPAFASGVKPGGTAGEWLFPALSAKNMRVCCNFGPGGFRHEPPTLYPGELGDRFFETTVVLQLTPAAPGRAATLTAGQHAAMLTGRILTEALLTSQTVLLTEEERAREVEVLPPPACVEWNARCTSILARPELDSEASGTGTGWAWVGVVLPFTRARALERLAGLRAAVAEIVELPDAGVLDCGEGRRVGVRVARVSERTTAYCAVASVAGLRKRLRELSNADLRKAAHEEWGVVVSEGMSRSAVLSAAADKFVRRQAPAAARGL